jgi:hypothetical protein
LSLENWRIAQVLTSEGASRCKPLRLLQVTAARTLARDRRSWLRLLILCKFSLKNWRIAHVTGLRTCAVLHSAKRLIC